MLGDDGTSVDCLGSYPTVACPSGFKTHGKSHLKFKTEGTSGSTKKSCLHTAESITGCVTDISG